RCRVIHLNLFVTRVEFDQHFGAIPILIVAVQNIAGFRFNSRNRPFSLVYRWKDIPPYDLLPLKGRLWKAKSCPCCAIQTRAMISSLKGALSATPLPAASIRSAKGFLYSSVR